MTVLESLARHVGDDLERTDSSTHTETGLGFPSAGDELELKWSGFLLAAVAFALTRFVVVDVVYNPADRPFVVVLAGLIPLVLGLGIVAYGVSIAVSTHSRAFANRVAVWYLVGSAGMAVIVGGSLLGTAETLDAVFRNTVFAGAVTAGGLGGVLFGRHTAKLLEYRREIERQNDRSVLLNRLLRHEILNSLTALRGHATLLAADDGIPGSEEAVVSSSDRIERTIEEVGFLVRTIDEQVDHLESVDLNSVLERCRDGHRDDGDVAVRDATEPLTVRADDQIGRVFDTLLETALGRSTGATVAVDVDADSTTARVRISAPGRWLDDAEREALVEGLPEFDGPRVGYGLSIAQLLVERYGGSIQVADGTAGTAVSVLFPRTDEERPRPGDRHGVDGGTMRTAVVAGLGAGIAMGLVLQVLSGQMAVIGGLYAIPTRTVGWITHLFHSVVFATLFAAVVSRYRGPVTRTTLRDIAVVGVAYSLLLWVVAGGVVMGIWLNLLGIPSPIPDLGLPGLVGHLVWGIVLVGSFHQLTR